jgi:hypothetical protein
MPDRCLMLVGRRSATTSAAGGPRVTPTGTMIGETARCPTSARKVRSKGDFVICSMHRDSRDLMFIHIARRPFLPYMLIIIVPASCVNPFLLSGGASGADITEKPTWSPFDLDMLLALVLLKHRALQRLKDLERRSNLPLRFTRSTHSGFTSLGSCVLFRSPVHKDQIPRREAVFADCSILTGPSLILSSRLLGLPDRDTRHSWCHRTKAAGGQTIAADPHSRLCRTAQGNIHYVALCRFGRDEQ